MSHREREPESARVAVRAVRARLRERAQAQARGEPEEKQSERELSASNRRSPAGTSKVRDGYEVAFRDIAGAHGTCLNANLNNLMITGTAYPMPLKAARRYERFIVAPPPPVPPPPPRHLGPQSVCIETMQDMQDSPIERGEWWGLTKSYLISRGGSRVGGGGVVSEITSRDIPLFHKTLQCYAVLHCESWKSKSNMWNACHAITELGLVAIR